MGLVILGGGDLQVGIHQRPFVFPDGPTTGKSLSISSTVGRAGTADGLFRIPLMGLVSGGGHLRYRNMSNEPLRFSIFKSQKSNRRTTTCLGGSPLSRGFSTGCPLPRLFPTSSTAPVVHVFVVRLLTVDEFLVFFALFLCNNDKSNPSGKFVLLRKSGVISPLSFGAVTDILLLTDFCKNCKLDMAN